MLHVLEPFCHVAFMKLGLGYLQNIRFDHLKCLARSFLKYESFDRYTSGLIVGSSSSKMFTILFHFLKEMKLLTHCKRI